MSIITKAEEATGAWWAIIPWYYYMFALLVVGYTVQSVRLHHAVADNTTLKANVATFQATQKTNLAALATCKSANEEWANKFNDEVANSKVYQDAANSYAQEETAKATKAQKTLDALYAHSPSDKAWSLAKPSLSVDSQLRANAGSSKD